MKRERAYGRQVTRQYVYGRSYACEGCENQTRYPYWADYTTLKDACQEDDERPRPGEIAGFERRAAAPSEFCRPDSQAGRRTHDRDWCHRGEADSLDHSAGCQMAVLASTVIPSLTGRSSKAVHQGCIAAAVLPRQILRSFSAHLSRSASCNQPERTSLFGTIGTLRAGDRLHGLALLSTDALTIAHGQDKSTAFRKVLTPRFFRSMLSANMTIRRAVASKAVSRAALMLVICGLCVRG